MKIVNGMTSPYEEYTDSQLINELVERFGYKQVELAKTFYVRESTISMIRSGKHRLRATMRQGVIELLIKCESENTEAEKNP